MVNSEWTKSSGGRFHSPITIHASSRQLAVPHLHRRAVAEEPRKRLDQIDRAMLAAGAADRNGEVAAVVASEGRQPVSDKAPDILEQLARRRIGTEKLDHRPVAPGQRAQARV